MLFRSLNEHDDDRTVLNMLVECMSFMGLSADVANNGKEALSFLERIHYDIIITDLIMPEVDGMELIKITRIKYPSTDILVISGYSDEHDFSDLINAGATDFIAKPFKSGELQAKIQRIFRKSHVDGIVHTAGVGHHGLDFHQCFF